MLDRKKVVFGFVGSVPFQACFVDYFFGGPQGIGLVGKFLNKTRGFLGFVGGFGGCLGGILGLGGQPGTHEHQAESRAQR